VLVLAFDTATDVATSALVLNGEVVGERASRAVRILEDVDSLLAGAALEREAIEGIVVGTGPGSYTGLRMGLVTARALAIALDAPLAGVSTLAALAAGAPGAHPVIDARRSELFTASYRQVPGGVQRLGGYQISSPDDLAGDLEATGADVLLVGDGGRRYCDAFADLANVEVGDQGLAHPSAASLVQLAHARALREDFVKPWELEPLYLRRPDAEINWSTRDALEGT